MTVTVTFSDNLSGNLDAMNTISKRQGGTSGLSEIGEFLPLPFVGLRTSKPDVQCGGELSRWGKVG